MELDGNAAKVDRMYRQDTGLVVIFIVLVWLALGFVLISISSLASNDLVRDVTLGAGSLAGIFVTSALIAVLVHLKKNKAEIYKDELRQIESKTDISLNVDNI